MGSSKAVADLEDSPSTKNILALVIPTKTTCLGSRTCDLAIVSPTPHRYTTEAPQPDRPVRTRSNVFPGGMARLSCCCVQVMARGAEVDSLAAAGDELVAILTELDCRDTPKARQIQSDVAQARRQLADITTMVDTKRSLILMF